MDVADEDWWASSSFPVIKENIRFKTPLDLVVEAVELEEVE
jgi:hypothetical protein